MLHRASRALAAAAIALVGYSAAAEAQSRVFDVSIGGIRAGEIVLEGERNGARYTTASTVRATGMIGALTRIRYEGSSQGIVASDGSVVPEMHRARSRSMRTDRRTEMVFQNGDPARVSMDPPRSSMPDPAQHAGTIDPVSAVFALLIDTREGQVCNSRTALFDGHRRSQIELGRAEARDDGFLVCNGRFTRLSGDALPTTDAPEFGFRLFYRDNGAGADLVRIEVPTSYGLAVATRRG